MSTEMIRVSIIIPAFNAAATLAETLASVREQTFADWEGIVVDDGSTDGTPSIAEVFARADERIRVVRQPNGGLSAARNRGISEAKNEWLLFLDADDLILRDSLERLVEGADPDAGAVYGGWHYLTPDGRFVLGEHASQSGDLISPIARGGQFPVHAYLVRREIVVGAGLFDTSLRALEDWDLWLRLARMGVQFRAVPHLVALYRIRHGSMSTDGRRMMEAALRVVERCASADPRIDNTRFPNGLRRGDFDEQRVYWLLWAAGSVVASGRDPIDLFDLLPPADRRLNVDPSAGIDFARSALLASGRPHSEWTRVWSELEPRAAVFARAVEARLGIPGFAADMVAFARLGLPVLASDGSPLARTRSLLSRRLIQFRRLRKTRFAKDAVRLGVHAPEIVVRAAASAANRRITRVLHRTTAAPQNAPIIDTPSGLPILMYHRIAPAGSDALAPFRVHPDAFDAQLALLKAAGYRSATFEEWRHSKKSGTPLPERAVIITFDDGYADFTEHALPILEKYGFGATVFIVSGEIGGTNLWDSRRHGESIPLLDWTGIRALRARGIEIGAHTENHPMLTSVSVKRAFLELRRSKRTLELGLGEEIPAIAYPFGLCSPLTFKLARACGFEFGVTCRPAFATTRDSALSLPRIDVHGKDTLQDFAQNLGIELPAVKRVA